MDICYLLGSLYLRSWRLWVQGGVYNLLDESGQAVNVVVKVRTASVRSLHASQTANTTLWSLACADRISVSCYHSSPGCVHSNLHIANAVNAITCL